jgi:hypothetical protein
MLDFWDLGKLLGRRWRISVPMLVLAIVLTAVTFTQVKPDYVATAYIQLVPPVPVAVPAGQPTPAIRNPWLNEDLTTLASAALVSVQDISYVQSLKDAGYSDAFTATMGDNSPLITFQVTAKSSREAGSTADQLVDRFDKSLTSLQTSYNVTSVDTITGRRLDAGTNVTKSSSNVKRAIAAVAVVGLLLAIAVTIGSDAWLRRRKRTKTVQPAAAAPLTPPAQWEPPASTQTVPLMMTRLFSAASNGNAFRAGTEREPADADRKSADADRKSADAARRPSANGSGAQEYDLPADATVILPKKAMPARDD